ncbi:DUF885 family protein [Kineococcus aurantiacus]|uniref:Uncharacterized protein (DUF885 family) n=1 Tax=Kineococcus aurantiacus TaxID=37633 RepID=A0A7Y9DM44_9ACTN|nr:uncharacterized protein (DUF885 family) [Kineococcus aurantiacus]
MTTTTPAQQLAELGERYFQLQHTYDPYNATLLGLTEFDHLPGDPSRAASERAAAGLAEVARAAEALDPAGLDEEQLVDRGVLTALARGAAQDAEHSLWAANASAKGYVSRQGLVFQAVPAMSTTDAAGRQRYLSRLAGLPGFFTALGERYAQEAAAGRRPTRLGVQHSLEQLEGHLALPVGTDALLAPARASGDPTTLREATRLVREEVHPALRALAGRMRTELLPLGREGEDVGIHAVPGGREGYAAAVRRHTTTDLTPEQIHRTGLDVLEEMRAEWSAVGARALGETGFDRIAERLRSDPALRFGTSEEILAVAHAALARAQAARDAWFPDLPIPDCAIEEINPVDAAGSALGHYRPPAVDGSRPGAYCVLAADAPSHFRYEYESLSFHEAVPGHHLQLATAQLLDVPRYRRHLDVEACSFNEGWGLYSEQLADEMGLFTGDLDRLGMLSFRALRACRLVVDTGIHHFGWTRERAVEFMYANTATTREHVESEVDRYVAWPGQALAYMIGCREVLRLRAVAEQALGGRFSIVEFHRAVLSSGAVPLTVLGGIVERHVAGALASAPAAN